MCRYLEMPVQHASHCLLQHMRRSHDRAHIEGLIGGVRRAFPDVAIRSEVIVGFPSETDDDFEELKRFIAEIEFASLGIFPYSPEPGTGAAGMDGEVFLRGCDVRVGDLVTACVTDNGVHDLEAKVVTEGVPRANDEAAVAEGDE